jgi:hypothetical protein
VALVHRSGLRSGDPHHSTFSKKRHGRFKESEQFEELFEQIVLQCVEVGLVQGKHLSVDGGFVEANAAKEGRIPREQLAEATQVNQSVRQYLWNWSRRIPLKSRCISRISATLSARSVAASSYRLRTHP